MIEGGTRLKGVVKAGTPERPLVSIVTIVRNGEACLGKAIDSVLSQTYPNVEYIIVDGGSTDKTLGIIRANEDKIAYWRSEKDSGISDAFNKGISWTSGEIVGILNADDWYEPDAIQRVVDAYLKDPEADIVYGWMNYWHGNELLHVYKSDHTRLPSRMSVAHTALFVAKRVYDKFGLFDLSYKYAMDYELVLRFFYCGVKFVYLDKVLSNMSTGGASYSNWIGSFREVARAKVKYRGFLLAYGYFVMQVMRKYVSLLMRCIGLGCLERWYRERFMSGLKQS